MRVLDKMKTGLLRLWRSQALKYGVVVVVGVLLVGIFDENSLLNHLKNRQRIQELIEEKGRYEADYQRDQAQIKELSRNPKAMEKIARERYFMKADDEDIFQLSDDDRTPQPIVNHEAAD